jgi:hypothetical protein
VLYIRPGIGLEARAMCDVVIFCRVFEFPLSRNAQKRNKKKMARGRQLDARPRKTFYITFLSFPYREALNQRNKKAERNKTKKNPPGNPPPPPKKYVPGQFFGHVLFFFSCFRTPLTEKRPKTHFKKRKNEVRTYFFLRAGADVRRFPVLFFLSPCATWC